MVQKQDAIVISGISCRLPESNNIDEFAQHLFNGDDMVTEDNRRWEPGYYGLPKRHAKLKDVNKFDAGFFGVHPKQANVMDPQLRLMLEVAYEAIIDAGINPQALRGTRTGVFVGTSSSETQDALTHDPEKIVGYSLTGCQHSMFANRLSFTFDFKGPSFAVDTACSSGLLAFQLAVDQIKNGHCDAALVCGTHLTLKPTSAMQFNKLGMLSPQGKCQSFDANADGYCRAEGVVAILLQKDDDAKRIYAQVLHAKSNTDGYKEQGVTYPNGAEQAKLLREVYQEAGVDPATVEYVECHGTGTQVGDPQETSAITEVFCKNRRTSLLIGSVKSNMGHAEPASGLASLAKIMVAMTNKSIPANLHYRQPNPNIPGLIDGRLKVVTKAVGYQGGVIGVNSFGFGGANTHVILRSFEKPISKSKSTTNNAQKLFTFCGRTSNAVERALKFAQLHSENPYVYSLMSSQYLQPISQFPYRGFTILDKANPQPLIDVQKVIITDNRRPIWFIYSGMGTHYAGMGKALMSIDVFKNTIEACTQTLKPYNVNVYDLIVNGGAEGNWCAVCICAIQIALTNTLKSIGIEPEGIIGHSFGEMAAGYGDGVLSLEEAILCAYYRTRSIMETVTQFPPGAMAAVGMTWEEAKARCPEGVVAACHNAKDSVTVSGEATKVEAFVAKLTEEGIFAKTVNSMGIAFHSPSMTFVAEPMRTTLNQVLKTPRKRSPRWISTSVPESKWNTPLAQYCSADYHVNNALSPVLFYEALQHVPEHAVLIEISPHCLLQAILRRAAPSSCISVGLLKAKHEDNHQFFLQALGKIYESGTAINVADLYPKIDYPAPIGTPSIASAIEWDHSQDWRVINMEDDGVASATNGKSVSCTYTIDPYGTESEDKFLLDHVIDDKALFPFAGHVVLAWRTLAKLRGVDYQTTSVTLEDINVMRATILSENPIKLDVIVSTASGTFEILDGDTVAACGRITLNEERKTEYNGRKQLLPHSETLTGNEVYKELRLRGYEYGREFRPIVAASLNGVEADLTWTGNWIPFIDAMLQSIIITERDDTLKLPVRIRQIRIDPEVHANAIFTDDNGTRYIAALNKKSSQQIIAGGVTLRNLTAQSVSRRGLLVNGARLVVEKSSFVKYDDTDCFETEPEKRRQLNEYRKFVNYLLYNCLKRLEQMGVPLPAASVLKSSLKEIELNNDERCQLTNWLKQESSIVLRVLNEIQNVDLSQANAKRTLINVIETGFQRLDDDPFWNAAFQQLSVVKSTLDLVLENVVGHYLTICCLESTSLQSVKFCRDCQATEPMLQTEIILVNPSDQIPVERLEQEQWSVQRDVDLNTVDQNADRDRYHVVFLDRLLYRQADIVDYLRRAASLLNDDGGYLLINEPTSMYELALMVSSLRGERLQQYGAERVYGVFYQHQQLLDIFDQANMTTVAVRTDPSLTTTVYLLKPKQEKTDDDDAVVSIDDVQEFSWIDPLKKNVESKQKIWLKSTDNPINGLVGLGLCLRAESTENRIRTLMNASFDGSEMKDLNTQMKKDMHSNVYRNGCWGTFRHTPLKDEEMFTYTTTEHAFINTLTTGDLSSLRWVESPNQYWASYLKTNPKLNLCSVYYASLNFRDIMLATGRLSGDAIPGKFHDRECLLGMEFAGRDSTGRRVMGLLPAQALATTVMADGQFLWPVKDSWTLEEAATVPVAYTTAYYALVIRGRIKPGDKVLIHAGSGGVGQAAIAVALSYDCEVYTTVSSEEKKSFLQKRFNLSDDRFANSRSVDFEERILSLTDGQGVDVVLNSLSEDKLQASVRCLATHGRFLEIGKFDLSNNSNLGMAVFLKNVTFHGILLDSLFDGKSSEWMQVSQLLTNGIETGVVRPLPTSVFESERVTEAFRFMAQGKHIGKVLLRIKTEEARNTSISPAVTVNAVRRTLCHPEHAYVITGGLGGFGLELAQWLVKRGATKIVLTSRSGAKTGYQKRCLQHWKENGVQVHISTVNTSTQEGARRLIDETTQLMNAPIGGLFHLAMVLRDRLFEDQTVGDFQDSADAKYWGTKSLDDATRRLPKDSMKWFVVFSSISCGRGNAGQTNYGWSNSAMERMMENRRRLGYHGLAIQWGAIGDVGAIMDSMMGDNRTVIGGTLPQRIPACMQVLDSFLQSPHCVVSSFVRAPTADRSSTAERTGDVAEVIGQILGVADPNQINADAQFGDLGLDSLMGVEIKQVLERQFHVNVSIKELRTLTLNKVRNMVNNKSTNNKSTAEPESNEDTQKSKSTAVDESKEITTPNAA